MVLGNKKFTELNIADGIANPASLDLTIGNKITLVNFEGYKSGSAIIQQNKVDPHRMMLVDAKEYEPTIRYTEVDLNDFPDGVWVRPGVGILCTTETTFKMPEDVVGQVILKSSRGREFFALANAGYFDNGFQGQGTLQIHAPVIPIFLQTGMRVVQMVFHQVDGSTFHYGEQPDAKYQYQVGPQGSKDAKFL